jgi:hypothetical protein
MSSTRARESGREEQHGGDAENGAKSSAGLVALEEVEQAEEEMQRLRHLVSRVSEELDDSELYAPNESREHTLS